MITVVGSGLVGSSLSFLIASSGLDDVVLLNRHKDKAIGESLDISNSIPKDSPISITGTDDFGKIKESKIVVVCASVESYTEERTQNLATQASMIKDVARSIRANIDDALFLIVSNPVDVLTFVFQKETSINSSRIAGIASSLDSSRLRNMLSHEFGVPQSKFSDALVLGEHGDTMVPIYSRLYYDGTNIRNILEKTKLDELTTRLRYYWKTIRKYKPRSCFGIAGQTYEIIKSLYLNGKTETPASAVLNGEYGERGVSMGVPLKLTLKGIQEIEEIRLDDDELNSLHESAETIRGHIRLATS